MKRRNQVRNGTVGYLLLLLCLFLSGCSGHSLFKLPAIPLPWQEQALPSQAGPPPLSVLVSDERIANERLRVLLDEFEALHPDIEVELHVSAIDEKDLQQGSDVTEAPDLILVDAYRFPELATAGILAEPGHQLDSSDDFYPNLLEAFRYNGTLYCLPWEVRTLALIYDRQAFADAGIAPPTTWADLRNASETLTDPSAGAFGLIVSPDLSRWLPFLYQSGGHILTANGNIALNSPAATAALEFYITVFRDNFAGQPAESNSRWAGEALGKGKGRIAIEGNWIIPYFHDEFPNFTYGVAPLPSGPAGRGTVAFTSCYVVTSASSRQNQAFALANFLTAREAMRRWTSSPAFMPTRISLGDAWLAEFPELAPFLNGITEARVWQFPPALEPLVRAFNRSMVELFAANIEPSDLLSEMQRVGQRTLE